MHHLSEELGRRPESLDDQIRSAVASRLDELSRDGSWRSYVGPWSEQLQSELSRVIGGAFCELTCSGTAALELLMRGMGIDKGDEVLLAGYDYPGTFAAIERVGARPVLVDIDANGWGLDLDCLDIAYQPTCKALLVSHLHGSMQPLGRISDWCRSRGVKLLQDACQCVGATYQGRPLAEWSDAVFISFGGGKVLSAGRGGAWLTGDPQLAQHTKLAAGAGSGAFELSQLQAAVVLAQLPYLSSVNNRCREFFSSVGGALTRMRPLLSATWIKDINETAFYQAGWLMPLMGENETTASVVSSKEQVLPYIKFGSGFPGFHRRSPRRCRIASPLVNTARAAEQTKTVHYSVATGGQITPELLASRLAAEVGK
ncbi:MAG: aminotransferase class V-fold PLP-dependent enzyme [Pirellulales bacterium]